MCCNGQILTLRESYVSTSFLKVICLVYTITGKLCYLYSSRTVGAVMEQWFVIYHFSFVEFKTGWFIAGSSGMGGGGCYTSERTNGQVSDSTDSNWFCQSEWHRTERATDDTCWQRPPVTESCTAQVCDLISSSTVGYKYCRHLFVQCLACFEYLLQVRWVPNSLQSQRSCWELLQHYYILVNLHDNYEGRSINKLQNGAIPLILKIWKIRNIRFVGNLLLNIQRKFLDDDVIIVTSSVHRTQSICVLFSPPVFCHNSQFITLCIQQRNEKKTNKLNKLMLPL